MTAYWIASVAAGGLVGWLVGWMRGHKVGYEVWLERRRKGWRKLDANERAIEEAKLLYEMGEIGEDELETRIGHLHDWKGNA